MQGRVQRHATAILLEDTPAGVRPIGSGVFIHHGATYLVTAAHVAANPEGPVLVRMTRRSGRIEDLVVSRWFVNQDMHEVAVARLPISREVYEFDEVYMPMSDDREFAAHQEGRQILFIGAYPKIPAMAQENRTMIRSGILGLTWQERVMVRNDRTGLELFHTVHLIDCYAHLGFSGAPCFVLTTHTANPADEARRRALAMGDYRRIGGELAITVKDLEMAARSSREEWQFLGILLGHFPHTEEAFYLRDRSEEGKPDLGVAVNAGIGLVVPRRFVWETLVQEDVAQDRDEFEASGRGGATKASEITDLDSGWMPHPDSSSQ